MVVEGAVGLIPSSDLLLFILTALDSAMLGSPPYKVKLGFAISLIIMNDNTPQAAPGVIARP